MNTQHFLIIIIARSTYCLRQSVCVHDSRTNCTVLRLFGLPLVLILFNYFQGAATETRAGDKVENLFDPKLDKSIEDVEDLKFQVSFSL